MYIIVFKIPMFEALKNENRFLLVYNFIHYSGYF